MIINLRGTHGSGKSSVVKDLLEKYPCKPLGELGKKHPRAYQIDLGLKKPVFAIGPYATACGGCDAIQPYDTIWPLVEAYAKKGHVIFEGALISVSVGSIGLAMAARKDCVVAYLDTPLEVCLERIKQRRAAKGNYEPLDPKNTVSKYQATERTLPKLKALGVRCEILKHKPATKQVINLLKENG